MKNTLINLSLLIGVSLAFLIFLELVVRLFFPSPKMPVIFDETIGYRQTPGSIITVFVQGEKISNKVNSLGFLDDEHSFDRPEDVYRIVFLGDSFLEAINFFHKENFSEILEEELNKIYKNRIEVINLGICGYGTTNEHLTLKKYGLKFSPDLTVLVFCNNDIENNFEQLSGDINPIFDVIDGKLTQVRAPTDLKGGSIRNFISDNLQFPRFLVHQFSKISFFKNILIDANLISAVKDVPLEDGAVPFELRLFSEDFSQDTEKPWQVTKALISEMAELSKSNNSDFLVVILAGQEEPGYKETVIKKYPELKNMDLELVQKTLKNYLEEQGIEYLDLLPRVQSAKENLHYSPEDGGHYNPAGHRVVAEAILDYLQTKKFW